MAKEIDGAIMQVVVADGGLLSGDRVATPDRFWKGCHALLKMKALGRLMARRGFASVGGSVAGKERLISHFGAF